MARAGHPQETRSAALAYAAEHGRAEAAVKFGVTAWTIWDWARRAAEVSAAPAVPEQGSLLTPAMQAAVDPSEPGVDLISTREGGVEVYELRADEARTYERVRSIVGLMIDGTWRSGASHTALAAEWKISDSRMRALAAEAFRYLMLCAGDPEQTRGAWLAGVEAMRIAALARTKTVKRGFTTVELPDPDYKTALQAYDLQAKVQGLVVQRVDARVQQVDRIEKLSNEEVLAQLEQALLEQREVVAAERRAHLSVVSA